MAKKKHHTTKHHTKRHKYPKKPKKPKHSASVKSWEGYDYRMKMWEQKCRNIDAGKKKKESLINKYMHC